MVLHHASTIQPKYQAMMHCGAIRVSSLTFRASPSLTRNTSKLSEYCHLIIHQA